MFSSTMRGPRGRHGARRLAASGAIVLAIMVLSLRPCAGQAFTVARDGEAACVLVQPEGASRSVAFAVTELARYLGLIVGSSFDVVSPEKAGRRPAIHVGPTPAAKAVLDQQNLSGEEALLIAVEADRVVLRGRSDRGTLYAVFRFLERDLGCRWLAADVEHIPKLPTIEIAPGIHTSAPDFDMRLFIATGRDEMAQWGLKLGMNGLFSEGLARSNGGCHFLPPENSGCHSYYRIIPTEKYFAEHPEWFPMIGGKRREGKLHGGQLCVTGPGLAAEFARNVGALFDAHPLCTFMSISPNDGRGWCECAECMALDKHLCGGRTTKQGLAAKKPFRGDRVFWFANRVAEVLAETHPGRKLLVLSYINYAEPPDTVKPLPNVIPWLCHYAPADYSRPIADPTSEPNAQFNELLTRWAKADPSLLFYAYVSKSMWWRLPRPVVSTFAADLKYLHSLGVRRFYCQSRLSDWALDGPLYYVLTKLMWDISADPEEIAQDWIEHMFGPGAAHMAAFYDAVAESIRGSGQSFSDNPPRHVPGLYSDDHLERAEGHLAAAMQATEEDAEVQCRVKKVEEIFRYGRHMIAALEAAHEFGKTPSVALSKAIEEHTEKAWEIYPYLYSKRHFEGIRMYARFGVICSGFGQPEQKGGRACWNSDETGRGDGRAGWATFYPEVTNTEGPLVLEMDVWGTSDLGGIVINTGGERKSYADGGIWNRVEPKQALSGKEQWDTLVFEITPELLAPGRTVQAIGFGGGDSQVWVSGIRGAGE